MARSLILAAAGSCFLVLSVLALISGSGARAATANIDVGNYYFCSSANSGGVCDTTVGVGDTVMWTVSSGTHAIAECDSTFTTCPPPGGFSSGNLSTGQSFSRTFSTAGVFEYWCSIHTTLMEGRITVAAQPTATATSTMTPTPGASPTAATPTPSPTIAPAVVPITGGAPADGSPLVWGVLMALIGALLVGGASLAIRRTRRDS